MVIFLRDVATRRRRPSVTSPRIICGTGAGTRWDREPAAASSPAARTPECLPVFPSQKRGPPPAFARGRWWYSVAIVRGRRAARRGVASPVGGAPPAGADPPGVSTFPPKGEAVVVWVPEAVRAAFRAARVVAVATVPVREVSSVPSTGRGRAPVAFAGTPSGSCVCCPFPGSSRRRPRSVSGSGASPGVRRGVASGYAKKSRPRENSLGRLMESGDGTLSQGSVGDVYAAHLFRKGRGLGVLLDNDVTCAKVNRCVEDSAEGRGRQSLIRPFTWVALGMNVHRNLSQTSSPRPLIPRRDRRLRVEHPTPAPLLRSRDSSGRASVLFVARDGANPLRPLPTFPGEGTE